MGDGLTPEFNRLSKADRLKLKTVAFLTAMSEFVRDDTKDHPWRFPFYTAYFLMVAAPLPLFGAGAVVLGATYVWTRLELIYYTKRLSKKITQTFNCEALLEQYEPFIGPDPEQPESLSVHNKDLMKYAGREVYGDVKDAGLIAWSAARKFFYK